MKRFYKYVNEVVFDIATSPTLTICQVSNKKNSSFIDNFEISFKKYLLKLIVFRIVYISVYDDFQDVFIVDQGLEGVWAWVGKRASEKERSEALRNARGFVKKKKYSNQTRVTRIVEGHETSEFKALFFTWKDDPKGI